MYRRPFRLPTVYDSICPLLSSEEVKGKCAQQDIKNAGNGDQKINMNNIKPGSTASTKTIVSQTMPENNNSTVPKRRNYSHNSASKSNLREYA